MPEKSQKTESSDPIIIKKYANRRLYNTDSSSYITLDHLSQMTREGRDFKVVDARSGEDITHNVLTQIIMEEENRVGQTMLPVSFLRQLISMYGDSMQSMVPHYLEASMEAFRQNQTQFREAMTGAFGGGPFGEIAKRNLAMFEAAAEAMTAGVKRNVPNTTAEAPAKRDDDLAALKEQMASLQAKLDKLG